MYQTRELLCQGRSVHRHLDLRNEGYSLYHFVFGYLTIEYCSFFYCLAIEMIGRLSWGRLICSTEVHIFEI